MLKRSKKPINNLLGTFLLDAGVQKKKNIIPRYVLRQHLLILIVDDINLSTIM